MSTEPQSTCCGGSIRSTELILTYTLSTFNYLSSRDTALLTYVVCSLTQATDTTNIRLVFAAVKETILQNALKDSGIL